MTHVSPDAPLRVRLLRLVENGFAIGAGGLILVAGFWPGLSAGGRILIGAAGVVATGVALVLNRRLQRLDPFGAGRFLNPIEVAHRELGPFLEPGERVAAVGLAERRPYWVGWIPDAYLFFADWSVYVTNRRLILAREGKPNSPRSTAIPIEQVRVERVRRRPLSRSVRVRWPNGSADLQFTTFFFRDGDSILDAIEAVRMGSRRP